MAVIKVKLNHEIIDGQPVTFISPCNCTYAKGLKVEYPGGSKTFSFKDAHGNDLTELEHLFNAGVYVKAVLDTKNGFAYLQNADTNKYLEGRFDEKVDKKAIAKKWDEAQNIKESGWYSFDSVSIGDHGWSRAYMRVESFEVTNRLGFTTVYVRQTLFTNDLHELVRFGDDIDWFEWEWVDPPLLPGFEYKTTERLNDIPVYVKMFEFGYLPSEGATKSISHGLNTTSIISLYATSTNGKYYFPCKSKELEVDLYMNAAEIKIVATKGSWSSYGAVVVVKYTKD